MLGAERDRFVNFAGETPGGGEIDKDWLTLAAELGETLWRKRLPNGSAFFATGTSADYGGFNRQRNGDDKARENDDAGAQITGMEGLAPAAVDP